MAGRGQQSSQTNDRFLFLRFSQTVFSRHFPEKDVVEGHIFEEEGVEVGGNL
jgi:hypothetical protein